MLISSCNQWSALISKTIYCSSTIIDKMTLSFSSKRNSLVFFKEFLIKLTHFKIKRNYREGGLL